MTRDHQKVVAYLLAENEVLRERLRGRRIRFSDAQRHKLARAAKALGRQGLSKLDTLVTPDTLLRWYRKLTAKKYDGTGRRGPAPSRRTTDVVELVIRIAHENPTWGYTRVRGALSNLGHELGCNTIERILLDARLDEDALDRVAWPVGGRWKATPPPPSWRRRRLPRHMLRSPSH